MISESNNICGSKHSKLLQKAEELMQRFTKPTTTILAKQRRLKSLKTQKF